MMIEGSGSGYESRYIHLTNGSGSERPKNMWIRWIRIRIRIRILNTPLNSICIVPTFVSVIVEWVKIRQA
jgi:hypothetical protein